MQSTRLNKVLFVGIYLQYCEYTCIPGDDFLATTSVPQKERKWQLAPVESSHIKQQSTDISAKLPFPRSHVTTSDHFTSLLLQRDGKLEGPSFECIFGQSLGSYS